MESLENRVKLYQAKLDTFNETATNITYYKGLALKPRFSGESIEYAMNEWSMPSNSVIVASYPKTGKPIHTFYEIRRFANSLPGLLSLSSSFERQKREDNFSGWHK